MTSAAHHPILTECPRCEGSGLDPASPATIPASYYSPAEGGSPCRHCDGSGEAPATCDDCGEPATEQSADGHHWCEVCAAEIAVAAERLLESVRAALSRSPRIARDVERARGVMVDAAN